MRARPRASQRRCRSTSASSTRTLRWRRRIARIGDAMSRRRQARGRDLVEQRLEQVVVVPVDERDVGRAFASARAADRPPNPPPRITMRGGAVLTGIHDSSIRGPSHRPLGAQSDILLKFRGGDEESARRLHRIPDEPTNDIARALVACTARFFERAARHHGPLIAYDRTKAWTRDATVTGFHCAYPHPQLFFDLKNADGPRGALYADQLRHDRAQDGAHRSRVLHGAGVAQTKRRHLIPQSFIQSSGWSGLLEDVCAPVDEVDTFNRLIRDPAGTGKPAAPPKR